MVDESNASDIQNSYNGGRHHHWQQSTINATATITTIQMGSMYIWSIFNLLQSKFHSAINL